MQMRLVVLMFASMLDACSNLQQMGIPIPAAGYDQPAAAKDDPALSQRANYLRKMLGISSEAAVALDQQDQVIEQQEVTKAESLPSNTKVWALQLPSSQSRYQEAAGGIPDCTASPLARAFKADPRTCDVKQRDITTAAEIEDGRVKQAVADKLREMEQTEEAKASADRAAAKVAAEQRTQALMTCMQQTSYRRYSAASAIVKLREQEAYGRSLIEHDRQVEEESGIVNMETRHIAGELIVRSREQAQSSFEAYKASGGAAQSVRDVKAESNPCGNI
jgi:hypothetical protein